MSRREAETAPPEPSDRNRPAGMPAWFTGTAGLAGLSAVTYWAALPPLDLSVLAWVAPLGWLVLIRRQSLTGKRPYRTLWLAGLAMWLGVLHWLRLPYWATGFGWLALSVYLAVYVPLFVGLSRVAVHRLRIPLIFAAPVVWCGLELCRAHVLTGFMMGSLGHSQYRWLTLIQISDLAGEYAVGFLLLFVSACIARMLPMEGKRFAWWPIPLAAAMLAATLLYGSQRLRGPGSEAIARVALVQGSMDVELFEDDARRLATFKQYYSLSLEAVRKHPEVQLVVWPETVFGKQLLSWDPVPRKPDDWPPDVDLLTRLKEVAEDNRDDMAAVAKNLNRPVILGLSRNHFGSDRNHLYNAALYLSAAGETLGCYDKNHPVMFGEYVPLGKQFPWLAKLVPGASGLDSAADPQVFRLGDVRFCPDICYETVLSHVIRRQVNQLQAQGQEPDVLLNLTNDGWFWGSSELDLHLACGVYRAVECRKPLLIAANTGFSAWIDGDGRIRRQGLRRQTDLLLAEVQRDGRRSWYLVYGDLPAGACLTCCGLLALLGIVGRRRRVAPSSELVHN